MSYQWKVGDKAVCILAEKRPDAEITKGAIYTIRDVLVSPYKIDEGRLGVRLEEVYRSRGSICECGWWGENFRPLIKTSIEIFERMLAPAPKQKELAELYRESAEKWTREHAKVRTA